LKESCSSRWVRRLEGQTEDVGKQTLGEGKGDAFVHIVNPQLEKRDAPYFTLGDAILDGNMG